MGNSRFRNAPFLFLVVILIPSAALADISPKQLLSKLFQSSSSMEYYASYVNIRPSGMEFSDVYNGFVNKVRYKRTVLSGDSDIEIISSLNKVSYFDANTEQKVSYPKAFLKTELELLSSSLEKTRHYYSIHVAENAERVAERETYRLSVMAKLPGRYSRVYWIDKRNFITLRIDVLDTDGQLIERIKCTSLFFKEQQKHKLVVSKDKNQFKELDVEPHSFDESIKFGWLPDEYEIVNSIEVLNDNEIEKQFMLSDGFSKMIVVINPHHAAHSEIEANHERDAWQKFVINSDGQQIMVSGDAPLAIVKKIATNTSL
jgi:negative regulator of sigma E activity